MKFKSLGKRLALPYNFMKLVLLNVWDVITEDSPETNV